MAKREISEDEYEAIEGILKTLAGFTVEQAEIILKVVAAELKTKAVIE